MIAALKVAANNVNDSVDSQIEDIRDSQISSTKFYFQKLLEFHQSFAEKINIFDPLDRKFLINEEDSEGNFRVTDQGLKCKQLKEALSKMEGVRGTELNVPLCP